MLENSAAETYFIPTSVNLDKRGDRPADDSLRRNFATIADQRGSRRSRVPMQRLNDANIGTSGAERKRPMTALARPGALDLP